MKKGIIGVLLVTAAVRLATYAGTGELLSRLEEKIEENGGVISATLSLRLGEETEEARGDKEAQSGEARAGEASEPEPPERPGLPTPEKGEKETISNDLETSLVAVTSPPEATPAPGAGTDGAEIVGRDMSADIEIKNDTGYDIDAAALMAEGLELRLEAGLPQVLIIHTHSSEAYTMDDFDVYVESDTNRTEDCNYNVVRVGDELAAQLESYGINVIHDRGIYDYPSYTGSYNRSGEAVAAYLTRYPSISIVIDLHRDAIVSGDIIYKTEAELPGESCAQVMLLAGTGENGLSHPNWEENLKLALYMQSAMNEKYPTLARPVAVKPERYNLHLTTGSLILEVGSSGNTLREALNAIRLFAGAVGPALAELVVSGE